MTKSNFKSFWRETRQTLDLAVPIITSQVGQLLLGVIDTLMIARLGVVELGASAFATNVFSLFLVFGFGLTSCVSPLVAKADGARRYREAGEILRHGVIQAFVFGLGLALIIQFLSLNLQWFGQPQEIVNAARPYLIVMGWSIIPALLSHAMRQFLEGLHRPMLPMIVMLVAVCLNALLNYFWIWGHGGFPALGLVGAAWSTFVVRFFMMLVLSIIILRATFCADHLPLNWFLTLSKRHLRTMFSLGFPSALQTLFEVGAFAAAAIVMGWISTEALAAHQIAINIVSITFMVILGLSFAVSIRVGHSVGREDFVAARRVGFSGITLSAAIMTIFALVILGTYDWIPGLYVDDHEVASIAGRILIVGALFQIFDGIQGVAIGALRGMHDVTVPTVIAFFAYWVISLPLLYHLAFNRGLGPVGVWAGLLVGLLITSFCLTVRFGRITQKAADLVSTNTGIRSSKKLR